MSTFADQLKIEIARIAKKEVRAETQAIKKTSIAYRGEIAALKRRIAGLEAQVKKLSKGAGRAKVLENAEEESGAALRFRVAGFAALRKKLGISAADMGKLMGVSAQSVYHWETGKTKPRSSQLAAISAVRKMGKKEVAAKLAGSQAEAG
jgi:DNA-binding transcriptional regulator YiaG